MKQSTDQLAQFEQRIRTEGVWCDTKVTDKLSHFMVCKHPKASIAISRCGMIVKPFEGLHENTVSQRCLVCELFENSGKEARELNNKTITGILEVITTEQEQDETKTN